MVFLRHARDVIRGGNAARRGDVAAVQTGGGRLDVLAQAAVWRDAGQAVAIATVVRSWGSAPRPAGSQLAVTQSGKMVGSVSGGCVENAVAEAALAALASGAMRLLDFGVSDDLAWEVGLPCGGEITVMVEPLT